MNLLCFFLNFFLFLFCFLMNPVAYGGVLISFSFLFSVMMGVTSSSWYGYMLFLVYVGGLLVLFLYVIMLSSNFYIKMSSKLFFFSVFFALMVSFMINNLDYFKATMGVSSHQCSLDMTLGLFLSLGMLLLLVFFAIVHIVLEKGKIIAAAE